MTLAYVYRRTEPELWTVGYYAQDQWWPESDHTSAAAAAARVHYLNGGNDADLLEACQGVLGILHEEPVRRAAAAYGGDYAIAQAEAAIAKATASEPSSIQG